MRAAARAGRAARRHGGRGPHKPASARRAQEEPASPEPRARVAPPELPDTRITMKRPMNKMDPASRNKRTKSCSFLCGAQCFITEDPVDPEGRSSIRWAYDAVESKESSGQGSNDWYCERTWAQ
eukprot:7591900-Lingulodinium_polyedra.AAC.1